MRQWFQMPGGGTGSDLFGMCCVFEKMCELMRCSLSYVACCNLCSPFRFPALLGFERLLKSPVGAAYSSEHTSTVYQDMTKPLSHYYIASSHNTYVWQCIAGRTTCQWLVELPVLGL